MVTTGGSPPVAVTFAPRVAEVAAIWVAEPVLTVAGSGEVSNDSAAAGHESPALLVARAVK